MSWKRELELQLDAFDILGTPGKSVTVAAPHGEIDCELLSVDAIGCSFTRLSLNTDRLSRKSVDELKELGDELSAKLNYLLEPICPIEIDKDGATVQLRSNPPQKDDDGTRYYELLVRRDGLALCRYGKTIGNPRQMVPANVTREVLFRLASDFVAAVE